MTTSQPDPISGPVSAARRIVEALEDWGVRWVFGVPGAKIDAVYDALEDSDIQVVACRHEQNAAFMAAAIGRLTGTPGVVLVTSGPGISNLATGLLTATTEGDPVVAICGAVPRADGLKRTHQTLAATDLLHAVTKWCGDVNSPDSAAEAVSNAFRKAAVMPRGATALVIPSDVQTAQTPAAIARAVPSPHLGPAAPALVEEAAAAIRAARLPVILAGDRASCIGGGQAIRALLGAAELPVVETFQGAGIVSRDLEDHFLGRVGLFRNQPGDVLLHEADLVLAIGYDPVEYDPGLWNANGRSRIIHLDEIPGDIDGRYVPALELRGDIPASVRALAAALDGFRLDDAAREIVTARRADLESAGRAPEAAATPGRVDPVALVRALRSGLSDDAVVACDVGSHYIYMGRYFRTYEPRSLLFSNGQQTLGVALPWAIAASLAAPGRQVVSVSGDGGFLFSGMELETAVRLGCNVTHVIFDDGSYDMVAFQQMKKYGRTSAVELGAYDGAAYAAAFGAQGLTVTSIEDFAPALEAALAHTGPSLITVPVDYADNLALLGADLQDGVLV